MYRPESTRIDQQKTYRTATTKYDIRLNLYIIKPYVSWPTEQTTKQRKKKKTTEIKSNDCWLHSLFVLGVQSRCRCTKCTPTADKTFYVSVLRRCIVQNVYLAPNEDDVDQPAHPCHIVYQCICMCMCVYSYALQRPQVYWSHDCSLREWLMSDTDAPTVRRHSCLNSCCIVNGWVHQIRDRTEISYLSKCSITGSCLRMRRSIESTAIWKKNGPGQMSLSGGASQTLTHSHKLQW